MIKVKCTCKFIAVCLWPPLTKCSPKRNLGSQKKAPPGLIAQDFIVCPDCLVFCMHFFQTSKGSLLALRHCYFRGSSPLQSIQNNEGCAAAHESGMKLHVWQKAWQKGMGKCLRGKGHYSWNSDTGLCSTGRLSEWFYCNSYRAYIWIIAPGFHLKQRQLFHFKRWLERTNTH